MSSTCTCNLGLYGFVWYGTALYRIWTYPTLVRVVSQKLLKRKPFVHATASLTGRWFELITIDCDSDLMIHHSSMSCISPFEYMYNICTDCTDRSDIESGCWSITIIEFSIWSNPALNQLFSFSPNLKNRQCN